MFSLTSTLQLDNLARFERELRPRAVKAVNAAGERLAEDVRTRSRVETGAQQSSVYVSGTGESDYLDRVNAARELRPTAEVFPEHRAPQGPGIIGSAVVAVGVTYGIYNDQGTIRQAADGFFTAPVESAKQWYAGAIKQAIFNG